MCDPSTPASVAVEAELAAAPQGRSARLVLDLGYATAEAAALARDLARGVRTQVEDEAGGAPRWRAGQRRLDDNGGGRGRIAHDELLCLRRLKTSWKGHRPRPALNRQQCSAGRHGLPEDRRSRRAAALGSRRREAAGREYWSGHGP